MSFEIIERELLPADIGAELDHYEAQILSYRQNQLDETKMQKFRLHFGTYAQRQEGVQMQRIKIPGGFLRSDQLTRLADAADRYGSGFLHFTTREDAQIYYVKLEEVPNLCVSWQSAASPRVRPAVTLCVISLLAIARVPQPTKLLMCCLMHMRCFDSSFAISGIRILVENSRSPLRVVVKITPVSEFMTSGYGPRRESAMA